MSSNPSLKPLAVSPREAARLMGVSRSRVYELLNSGELPSYKDGRRRLILVSDIETWLGHLTPAPKSKRAPPTGPLLSPEQQEIAVGRAGEPDWAALHHERVKLLRRDVSQPEAEARALEYVIQLCHEHQGCDLEAAKATVLTAVAPQESRLTLNLRATIIDLLAEFFDEIDDPNNDKGPHRAPGGSS
jgi:excisionase family DNA binding protein